MISFIRKQTGITQFNLSCLLRITRQQLSMTELGKRTLPLNTGSQILCIVTALQNPTTLPDGILEQHWFGQLKAYKKKLADALQQTTSQQRKLQRQLAASRDAYTKAIRLWQLCLALQNEPLFADERDRLVIDLSVAQAKAALKTHHPYRHSEIEMQLQLLQQQVQCIEAAMSKLPE
jgi:transcriptional regulator with XRE-family HTH domain